MLNLDALAQLKELKSQLKSTTPVLSGTVRGSNGKFGFVVQDSGEQFFLPPDEMAKVFPGDLVEFTDTTEPKGKTQAAIDKLMRSDLKTLFGRFIKRGNATFVEPDMPSMNHWVYIPPEANLEAVDNDWVEIEITRHPFPSGKPQGKVIQLLGNIAQKGFERRYGITRFGLSETFPEAALAELAGLNEEKVAAIAADREDLSELPFVTIDGESTQDMDDALYAERSAEGFILHVAIADPAALIAEGSALDNAAKQRANSVYFPDGPLPMLPEAIANGLCSLVPGKKRLCMVVDMHIDNNGAVSDVNFREAVISSHGKLSYNQVSDFIEGDKNALREALQLPVSVLYSASQALNKYRQQHNLVMDERPDYRFVLDENGKGYDSIKCPRNAAQKVVEECMLATNLASTRFMTQQGKGLFIRHNGLRSEKHEDVKRILEEQQIALQTDIASAEGFRQLINAVAAHNSDKPLKRIMLRMLERSEISLTQAPHAGMGFEGYTTFTSPIRKYHDLCVHRIIKAHIGKGVMPQVDETLVSTLQANQLIARQANNLVESWFKCEVLQHKSGETLLGKIVGVNPSGIIVQLDASGIEGMVDLRKTEPRFSFDPLYMTLANEQQAFCLEQEVNVRVSQVDINQRKINFELA
ncbi:MAG: VacB/RNase II family 3'-5' exoribonuclease [Oceanospirillaceae bacterium]|nr:VacB/RNase II family 3'-5' exoribonuclease [Oceanospirillaceae bacterium]MCP5350692.1 VacB/RNase II family 3'-5' exoribonuclease [Oceanospirillaceae bacterium]